jgi:hypothetical protein
MPRLALDGDCGRARVRIALDNTTQRCAPCTAPITDPDILDELTGRVIVRHRTQTGTDADGTPEYGWATLYDGPGYWSDHTTVETSDAAATGIEIATVRIAPLDDDLGTAASVWDHNETRWTVASVTTSPLGDTLINLERVVDSDT